VAGPEQLEDVRVFDQFPQAVVPAFPGAEGEHILEELAAQRVDGLGDSRHNRAVQVGVRREDLAVPPHRLRHQLGLRSRTSDGDAYRDEHLTEDQRATPNPHRPADRGPSELGRGKQPEHDLVHRFPPLELGVRRIAPNAWQVGDDPQ
jgi:hypothetical protein